MLLLSLADGAGVTRQPDRELVAEPVDNVVGPGGLDQLQRQAGPLRELRFDQPPDQRAVDSGSSDGHGRLLPGEVMTMTTHCRSPVEHVSPARMAYRFM
jgi:hypothetical protein